MALLNVRTAAARLGIGYSTLKQWIFLGKVRTRTTEGGHHRIDEAEVERLLARQPESMHGPSRPNQAGVMVALSGRNQLRGFVKEVRRKGLLGQVRLRVGDQTLTAVITSDALNDLKLRRGDDALAIIKSTEVMIAREIATSEARPLKRRRRKVSSKDRTSVNRATNRRPRGTRRRPGDG